MSPSPTRAQMYKELGHEPETFWALASQLTNDERLAKQIGESIACMIHSERKRIESQLRRMFEGDFFTKVCEVCGIIPSESPDHASPALQRAIELHAEELNRLASELGMDAGNVTETARRQIGLPTSEQARNYEAVTAIAALMSLRFIKADREAQEAFNR